MKVYEVHYDNGESYEDHHHSVEAIFISKELAENYAKKLTEDNKAENERNNWNYDKTTWAVREHIVLTEFPTTILLEKL